MNNDDNNQKQLELLRKQNKQLKRLKSGLFLIVLFLGIIIVLLLLILKEIRDNE